jgi:hypothetical protein
MKHREAAFSMPVVEKAAVGVAARGVVDTSAIA